MEAWDADYDMTGVSVSEADKANDSPKLGDFIATNPKDVSDKWLVSAKFIEENYDEIKVDGGLSFGNAIEALKQGKRVCRQGWNGKGMFVFMQVPATINKEIVPKMQSLPQTVKDEFQRRFDSEDAQVDAIYYDNQLAIVNTSNLVNGWAPSVSDALAEDWIVLE